MKRVSQKLYFRRPFILLNSISINYKNLLKIKDYSFAQNQNKATFAIRS